MASSPESLSEDRGSLFRGAVIPFIVLPVLAISLRIWSRAIGQQRQKFWWDDWTAILACIIGLTLSAIGIAWTNAGLGRHAITLTPAELVKGHKLLWASYFLFITGVAVVKISALLFYQRVFARLVTFLCTVIFNCTPIDRFWNDDRPGSCIDLYSWYLSCGAANVVLDIVVLVLPMPMVWNLQLRKGKKLAVFAALFCGYLALVPSLGRLASTAELGHHMSLDFTYRAIPDLLWSYIEMPIDVISLCIPSWFHLYQHIHRKGWSSLLSTHNTDSTYSKPEERPRNTDYAHEPKYSTPIASSFSAAQARSTESDLEQQTVLVTSDVTRVANDHDLLASNQIGVRRDAEFTTGSSEI